ncbi:MAG TPA: hypothetical protein VN175_14460 [Rhizomicrobium sp.]|nr:hypothetical protein [Rhizomicrobium sp.]
MRHQLEPNRLASSLFLSSPEEAYEVALDFLNGALFVHDRERAMTWTTVLTLIEKMQSDYQNEPGFVPEMRLSSMM